MSRIIPVVCILGGPGSGKSTECKLLERDLNLKHVAAGELLRAQVALGTDKGAAIKEIMEKGQIVPSEWTISLILDDLADLQSTHQGILLDGFPRNLENLDLWRSKAPQFPIACLIELDCPKEVILDRILARASTGERIDDLKEIVDLRMASHERDTRPVIDQLAKECRVICVDSSAPPKIVHAGVLAHLPSWE